MKGGMASINGLLFVLWVFVLLHSTAIEAHGEEKLVGCPQHPDKVIKLPGQPSISPPICHFSGFITVNASHGRALFYWFFQALSNRTHKSLLLWLNGGPGCSSVGYGAAVELGPFRVNNKGNGLDHNKYSWIQEANVLFLESPIGVGFSYSNTSSDFINLDDKFVAKDAYSFLLKWMKRFPRYQGHDFFISGESYAGHYVPQLADLIYDGNKNKRNHFINLKGFIVGNPETEDFYDSKGLVEYAWSHSVISDQLYQQVNHACNFKLSNWTRECANAMNLLFEQYKEIDIYNIYAPKCTLSRTSSLPTSSSSSRSSDDKVKLRRMRILGGYDPCYEVHTEAYFNRDDVQEAFHSKSPIRVHWQSCNNSIFEAYNYVVLTVLPIYTKLIKAGLKIWVYSGDIDGRVPVIGTRYWLESMALSLKTPWRTWYHNNQVGGRIVEYEGLTFVTVRGAGHLVPLNKPGEALALIHSFLSGNSLATKP
ncbi:hypothetical protein AMTRI_Chr02g220730 [Amborella trichopoda]